MNNETVVTDSLTEGQLADLYGRDSEDFERALKERKSRKDGADKTETIRRKLVTIINSDPTEKEELEIEYGSDDVFDTGEASKKFDFIGFMAPFAVVKRKKDGVKGTLTFQDHPRYYFNFQEVD